METQAYAAAITRNFERIDHGLGRLPADSLRYKMLFALRTDYAVRDEVARHKGEHTARYKFKALLKFFAWLLLFPWLGIRTECRGKIVILGDWRFDDSLSKHLGIPLLRFVRFCRFARPIDFVWGCKALFAWIRLLGIRGLSRPKLLWCASAAMNFAKYYCAVDLQGVRTIVTENDLTPHYVAILMRAKEQGAKRVKIEYVQIDSLVHNNVFCDYYFYPTTYHRRIREASPWNDKLTYIEGGYLNTDYLGYTELKHPDPMPGYVTFYTSHSNVFEHDDLFYIGQILAVLPVHLTLCIKVHPYDEQNKYDHLSNHPQVRIIKFGSIDNAALIAQSTFCLSQFSVMSLEAKQNCPNSYFLNYAWRDSQFAVDYTYLNTFFDTIDTPEMLRSVLRGEYSPVRIETFRRNVNMTFPHTFDVFNKFLTDLS